MTPEVAKEIWNLGSFQNAYSSCLGHSAEIQLSSNLIKDEHETINWRYLLEAASIFLYTEDTQIADACLRIAHTCLLSKETTEKQKSISVWLLEMMRNDPSIRLAFDKNLISDGIEQQRPTLLNIQSFGQVVQSIRSVHKEGLVRLTKFQQEFWHEIEEKQFVAASAATAAGKSHAIILWLCEALFNNEISEIIYIAPTRALVSEVEQKFLTEVNNFQLDASVSTVPWALNNEKKEHKIYVLTQERLHILLNRSGIPTAPEILVVDEAHKIDEDVRGLIMESVTQQVWKRFSGCKIIFVSPFTENPEILVGCMGGEKTSTVKSHVPTVNQNLLWLRQRTRKPQEWFVDLVHDDKNLLVGQFHLQHKHKSSKRKKLAMLSAHIGNETGGNVIYTDGAYEAEEVSRLISQLVGQTEDPNDEIKNLQELCAHTIHKDFLLGEFLEFGVAFHYGNIPEILRREIERQFSKGTIRFLVCTSTLIEGVNLSCRNIFLRGPKKGSGNLMRPEDFWNLAGRAGRWGREFAGNIFCIDPKEEAIWYNQEAPRTKKGIRIERKARALYDKIISGTPTTTEREAKLEDAALSLLVRSREDAESLESIPLFSSMNDTKISDLKKITNAVFQQFSDEPDLLEVINKSPHVSPLKIIDLYKFFNERASQLIDFYPCDPTDHDSVQTFAEIFKICSDVLGATDLGGNEQLAIKNAIVVCRWMSGWQIPRIVESSIKYWESRGSTKSKQAIIRDVLKDIENVARFSAPNYLSCYADVLQYVIKKGNIDIPTDELERYSIMLEYGVSTTTELSLISLGLSRNTAISLFEKIAIDNLSPEEVVPYVERLDIENLDIPRAIKNEVHETIPSSLKMSKE